MQPVLTRNKKLVPRSIFCARMAHPNKACRKSLFCVSGLRTWRRQSTSATSSCLRMTDDQNGVRPSTEQHHVTHRSPGLLSGHVQCLRLALANISVGSYLGLASRCHIRLQSKQRWHPGSRSAPRSAAVWCPSCQQRHDQRLQWEAAVNRHIT